jgi:pilus assembly protein Flp/PilA
MEAIKDFIQEEDGVTAIEYGLIAALVAVAIIVGATALGTNINALFSKLGTCIGSPSTANCAL